ncbi:MAG: hypothetical protein IJ448_00985 [Oscillospiraceae bacterium]|nr:hypothetical protein [Oscillospiraceae bacterium]
MKKYFALLSCLSLALVLVIPATAWDATPSSQLGDEISMPKDLAFEIHDSCWEHDWFEQYHAREDGWYIVMYFVANLNGGDALHFDRVYVDIFNADGVFQKELSFNKSDSTLAARLTDTAVEIYLTNCYLSYDLATEAVTCHYTPSNYVRDSGLYTQLFQAKKQIGEWTYKSKGLPKMYDTLTREKDGSSQTILKLKGSSMSFPNIIPYILSSAVTIAVFYGIIGFVVKKKRKT